MTTRKSGEHPQLPCAVAQLGTSLANVEVKNLVKLRQLPASEIVRSAVVFREAPSYSFPKVESSGKLARVMSLSHRLNSGPY